MLQKLLLNTEAKKFASFVSPTFFDVMPGRKLWSRAKELRAASRNPRAKEEAVKERSRTLEASDLSIAISSSSNGNGRNKGMSAERRGGEVVALYFHQIFAGDLVIFDLRARSFMSKADRLLWRPRGWIARFRPEFVSPLRDIYRGFYENDDSLFRQGLDALELRHAEDVFRKHFGEEQESVRFRTKDFIDTFHEVFVRCRNANTTLHEDFLPLGLYLATLYEHLETLEVAVDVEQGYRRGASVMVKD